MPNNIINKPISQKLPFLDDFLLYLTTSNYSKATIRNYERDLAIFEDLITKNGWNFSDLTKKTLTIYTADLLAEDRLTLSKETHAKPLNPKSINRMLTSIRTYLTYLIDNDYSVPILPQQIKLMKLGKKVLHLPPLETLIEFIESPQKLEKDSFIGLRNRLVLELIFASGMRISEVTSLTIQQVSGEEGKVFIRGKGNKERFVYLTSRVLELLDEYLDARRSYILAALPSSFRSQTFADQFTYLFITKKTFDMVDNYVKDHNLSPTLFKSRISENYLQAKLKSYRLLLGITQPLSAHTLRHGFATYLAESGANPAALKVLLGHESLETTTKYVHASDNYAEKTHHTYHPLKK